jgi:hypothetical protein
MMMRITAVLLLLTWSRAFSPSPLRRILVSGNYGTLSDLAQTFKAYGKIEEIRLSSAGDDAFVTFVHSESALAALNHKCDRDLDISPSRLLAATNSATAERTSVQEWETLTNLAHQSNIVVQVSKAHLEQFEDYMKTYMNEKMKIVGSLDSTVSSTSLLFLQSLHGDLINDLYNDDYLIYNKLFPNLNHVVRGNLFNVAQQAWSILSSIKTSVIRLQVYPPTLQSNLATALEEFRLSEDISFSNTDYTHVVSVVGLTPEGNDDHGGLFLTGVSQPSSPLSKRRL